MDKQIQCVEDLVVLTKAYEVSLELHEASQSWPKHEQFRGIADQIRRASKGICANLAEGFGKQAYSKAEFKRYIAMAIGSADEIRVWLSYAKDLSYMSAKDAQIYRDRYQTIAKMLTGLHKSWA